MRQTDQRQSDDRQPAARMLWLPIACAWLLMLNTFSAPGREGPETVTSLDVIALAKVAVRFGSIVALGFALYQLWGHPRRAVVLRCLMPFGLYLLWAFLSVLWSPLKAVSLGQALGLLVMLQLAAVLGIVLDGPRSCSLALAHLSFALFTISTGLIVVDFTNHNLSGLNREDWSDEATNGIVHPTSAGATASLGLVILVAVRLLWGWRWSRGLLLPGLFAHSLLLVLAASRMATIMAGILLLLLALFYLRRVALAAGLLACCLGLAVYVIVDPELQSLRQFAYRSVAQFTRGESTESMQSFTGRTALWEAMWESFRESPVVGHGYFVTSRTGQIDVWSGPANRTAHNFFLQVLVTTGLVGFALFLWALMRLIFAVVGAARRTESSDRRGVFVLLLGFWYLGWGQLCESFMGPIQPEAVLFYSLVGFALSLVPSGKSQTTRAAAAQLVASSGVAVPLGVAQRFRGGAR
jgi:O-antigen ligase